MHKLVNDTEETHAMQQEVDRRRIDHFVRRARTGEIRGAKGIPGSAQSSYVALRHD
jgi:hypothetical protein